MSSIRKFFFEYEDIYDVSSPTDYPYLIMLRHLLTVISSWPLQPIDHLDERAEERKRAWTMIQRIFHLCICLNSIIGAMVYVIIHKHSMDFFELGHIYITQLMGIVIFSRITTLCFSDKYRDVGTNFLTKFHLFFYKNRSEYSMQTHKKVHRISHLFTLWLTAQMIAGLSLFNLIPMYNNYSSGKYKSGGLKNSTFEHSLYISYPFNVSTNMRGYIFINIFHWFISYWCSTWFCMFDLFLSIMVFHVWGHFKILLHDLNNFPRPSTKISFMFEDSHIMLTNETYSSDELIDVSDKLYKCIDYHREIINFTDRMSEVFGPMMFAFYAFHQASGCLLLLECSQMTVEALVRYLPLTVILFQLLFQLSIIFELVGSVSDKLKYAVYGLPWECMDTKNRKTVALFLMNVQEPVHVKALGLAKIGVASMTTILKTSMSFFTFLRSK